MFGANNYSTLLFPFSLDFWTTDTISQQNTPIFQRSACKLFDTDHLTLPKEHLCADDGLWSDDWSNMSDADIIYLKWTVDSIVMSRSVLWLRGNDDAEDLLWRQLQKLYQVSYDKSQKLVHSCFWPQRSRVLKKWWLFQLFRIDQNSNCATESTYLKTYFRCVQLLHQPSCKYQVVLHYSKVLANALASLWTNARISFGWFWHHNIFSVILGGWSWRLASWGGGMRRVGGWGRARGECLKEKHKV